jgi:hypothetical protein
VSSKKTYSSYAPTKVRLLHIITRVKQASKCPWARALFGLDQLESSILAVKFGVFAVVDSIAALGLAAGIALIARP